MLITWKYCYLRNAMTPENKVKAKVKKVLQEQKIYYAMPATGGYGSSGVPDILVCHEGKFYGLECKANGGKPTALQTDNLERIKSSGGVAVVVDEHNVDSIMKEYFK